MNNMTIIQMDAEQLEEIIKKAVKEAMGSSVPAMPVPEAPTPSLTTKQLCEFLNVSSPTIIRWKQKGKIPYYNIGSAVRFDLKKVLAALEK